MSSRVFFQASHQKFVTILSTRNAAPARRTTPNRIFVRPLTSGPPLRRVVALERRGQYEVGLVVALFGARLHPFVLDRVEDRLLLERRHQIGHMLVVLRLSLKADEAGVVERAVDDPERRAVDVLPERGQDVEPFIAVAIPLLRAGGTLLGRGHVLRLRLELEEFVLLSLELFLF